MTPWVAARLLSNVWLRAEVGVTETRVRLVQRGEDVQVHRFMLLFSPEEGAPYGRWLWGYVQDARGARGWMALGEMDGWEVARWYVKPSQPLYAPAGHGDLVWPTPTQEVTR